MNKRLTFHHPGSMGDIVYALPTIQCFGGGDLYIGGKELFYNFMFKLLEIQPCIGKVYCYRERASWRRIDINLYGYRRFTEYYSAHDTPMHLAKCHLEVFDLSFDLTKPWLVAPAKITAPIIVSRSIRYHHPRGREEVDYNILESCKDYVAFVGDDDDYGKFRKHFFEARRLPCENALDMAQYINGAALFVGNQSLGFALAEAMKVPRVLEVCYKKNNCQPNGPNAHTVLTQEIIDAYVN